MNIYTLFLLADEFTDKLNVPKVDASAETLTNVLNGFFLVIGALAVFFVVLGGIQYSTSSGDPSSSRKAREMIIYALVGLGVVVSAFAIVNFVLKIGN